MPPNWATKLKNKPRTLTAVKVLFLYFWLPAPPRAYNSILFENLKVLIYKLFLYAITHLKLRNNENSPKTF